VPIAAASLRRDDNSSRGGPSPVSVGAAIEVVGRGARDQRVEREAVFERRKGVRTRAQAAGNRRRAVIPETHKGRDATPRSMTR
jgi:hypothetical protein